MWHFQSTIIYTPLKENIRGTSTIPRKPFLPENWKDEIKLNHPWTIHYSLNYAYYLYYVISYKLQTHHEYNEMTSFVLNGQHGMLSEFTLSLPSRIHEGRNTYVNIQVYNVLLWNLCSLWWKLRGSPTDFLKYSMYLVFWFINVVLNLLTFYFHI